MGVFSQILFRLVPIVILELALTVASVWFLTDSSGLKFGSWPTAEWLINYQSGFVRRGFMGEMLFRFGSGALLPQWVYWQTYIFYIAYCLLFLSIYFLAKIKNTYVLILALLLPGGIFQMGMTIQFFTRKEIVFLILYSILCLLYLLSNKADAEKKKSYFIAMFLCAIFGGIVSTLTHEAYLFMSYPITAILLWVVLKENRGSMLYRSLWWFYLLVIPLIFSYCSVVHGTPEIAQAIWDSLSLQDREYLSPTAPYTVFGPIASIGWGLQEHLLTIYGIFATGAWAYWPIFFIGNSLVLCFIIAILREQFGFKKKLYCLILCLGAILSSFMFLIAADWGRWLAFLGNSMILLSFTLTQSAYIRESISHVDLSCFSFFSAGFIFKNLKVLFLIAITYELIFRLPECCMNAEYLFMPYDKFLKAFL